MNRHLLSMLQEGYTTIAVHFMTGSQGRYIYKTRDKYNIGDLAVVKVGDEFKIVKVIEVHKEPEIDINLTRDYKWAVCKIDMDGYNEEMQREAIFKKQMFKIERDAQKRTLATKIKEHMDAESQGLFDNALKILNKEVPITEDMLVQIKQSDTGF